MFLEAIREQIKLLANPAKAQQYMRFFKTGKGQYGAGDIFVGLSNPQCRQIAKNNYETSLKETEELIQSSIHEERFIALVLMNNRFKRGNETERSDVFKAYIRRMKWVNNWDLVDISAYNVIGAYLLEGKGTGGEQTVNKILKKKLYQWVESPNLWFRRISIISTFSFIRANLFADTLELSKKLLDDKQDLIHKAVGWMLREVGKRDTPLLLTFLKDNYDCLPRTTLRYAIQKFEEDKRKKLLKGIFQ